MYIKRSITYSFQSDLQLYIPELLINCITFLHLPC